MKSKISIFAFFASAVLLITVMLSGCDRQPAQLPAVPQPTDGQETAATPPANAGDLVFSSDARYHYDMVLTLDPDKRTVGGHVVFDFFNDSDDEWDRLCMRDYSSLFIDAKKVGYAESDSVNGAVTELSGVTDKRDVSAIRYEREDDPSVLWLCLASPLMPGEWMTLEYDFTAVIPTIPDRYGVENGMFNVSNFYPILAEYADGGWSHEAYYSDGECFFSEIADYDVTVTTPADYVTVATGTMSDRTGSGDSVTCTFTAPCVRDFVFASCAGFATEQKVFDGVRVNVSYNAANPPEDDMSPYLETMFKAAGDSLAAFGEAFGKYPYKELDIVLTRLFPGGMEYPNLIYISESYCSMPVRFIPDDNGSDVPLPTDTLEDLALCVAHEIGHQWFMGIVGSNSGLQPWQDESLASYSEVVYLEYIGEGGSFDWYARSHGRRNKDISDTQIADSYRKRGFFPLNRSYYDFPEDRYSFAIYNIGKDVFFQMEEIIGREELYAVIREYVRRNAFDNAEPGSFFDVLFEYEGRDNSELNALLEAAFDL